MNYVQHQPTKRSNAALKMIISMIIFGSIGYFTVLSNLPSFELVFVRCMSATLFLTTFWIITGKYKSEKWNKKEILLALACGFFLVYNWVFLFKSFEETSITIAISVYHLAPVFVLILGSIIFKERLTLISISSIIICFIGTFLISDINLNQFNYYELSEGIIWALLAALFYAFTTLLSKGIKVLSPYATTFIQTFLGIFILIPFINISEFQYLNVNNWIFVLATGIIHTGLVYLLFFDSVRYLPTKLISVLVFLDPAVAILLDMLFIGFFPSLKQTIGIILIYSGMALSFVKTKKKKRVAVGSAT